MENKMDEKLIPNEEGQLAEEAIETPQPQQQRPPSYTSPVYPNGPQGVHPPQQPQNFIIQNIPVQQNQGCCGSRSEWFKHSVGVTTGVMQLVLAIIASILSGVTIYLQFRYDQYFGPIGSPIGATIFIFLPAGILGACSKNKSSCVIVGYLVMSILAAIQAFFVCATETTVAIFSRGTYCPDYFDPFQGGIYPEDGIYPDIAIDYTCTDMRYKCLTALHSVIAILMFIEFIVAIVASAICCNGLTCCCAQRATQQTQGNTMVYYPQTPAQMGTHVVQGSELPVKA